MNINLSSTHFSSEFSLHSSNGDDFVLEELVSMVKFQLLNEIDSSDPDVDEQDFITFVHRNDYNYIERYLEKNEFNVEKTVEMMKKMLRWRKK
ncbi:hypothetical protein B4U79_19186, partial [Dinothrombium tinctorium]